jgi:hypothetical protein
MAADEKVWSGVYSHRLNINDPFVPPNPKLFERA